MGGVDEFGKWLWRENGWWKGDREAMWWRDGMREVERV